jgi:hypothetical protein
VHVRVHRLQRQGVLSLCFANTNANADANARAHARAHACARARACALPVCVNVLSMYMHARDRARVC